MEKVEDFDLLVKSVMTRREIFLRTGQIMVGGAFVTLTGCGGAWSATGSFGFTLVNGSVLLPPGSSLGGSKLVVDVVGQTVNVSGGGFSSRVSSASPCLAVVNDSAGIGVIMAFLDPASSTHQISARTTGIALVFVALGAYLLPGPAMSHALQLIDAHSATSTLESVIASAIAADAHALHNNAASITPAVIIALDAILGANPALSVATPKHSVAKPADSVPTLLLVNPSSQQNGVNVSQDASTSSIILTNSFRRHCQAYLYETTTLTGNTTVDVSPAKLVKGPIELDSVEQLNLWTAAKDFTTFFHGLSPWSPISLPAIPINLETGTDRTTYSVVVLGSSYRPSGQGSEPAFFSDPHFVNEVSGWRVAVNQLFVQSFMGDIFLPLVCMIGGFGAVVASQTVTAAISIGFGDYAANFKNIVNGVRAGKTNVAPSLVACLEDAILNQVTRDKLGRDLESLLDAARAQAFRQFTSAQFASRLSNVLTMLQGLSPLFAVGALLEAGDIGATLLDVADADFGDLWTVLILKQTLKLSPQLPSATPGETVTFIVNPPSNTSDIFEYDWTQTSAYATLSASDAVGNKITTKSLSVNLVTTGSDTAPITITVTGYDVTTGQRVEIGRAGTVVKMLLTASITPLNPELAAGDKKVFSVQVSGTVPNGATYKWTLTGTSGTIGNSTVEVTTNPYITYIANVNGTDHLHVDVLDSSGALIAKADDTIQVGPLVSTVALTIAGSWTRYGSVTDMPPNGTYNYKDGQGARFLLSALDSTAPANWEAIDISYDNYPNSDGSFTPGYSFTMVVLVGETLVNGKSYPLQPTGYLQPDHFNTSIQAPLDNPQGIIFINGQGATGSVIFTNLNQSPTGNNSGNFTVTFLNATGGSIFATGLAVWKHV